MTEWIDTGDICPTCDYNGKHLRVEEGILVCGQCKQTI